MEVYANRSMFTLLMAAKSAIERRTIMVLIMSEGWRKELMRRRLISATRLEASSAIESVCVVSSKVTVQ